MAQIICYGSLTIDELLWLPRWPAPGDDLHALREIAGLGGPALNIGLPLAHWGHRVAAAGNAIGDDHYGLQLLERLAAYSIDGSAVLVESGRRTTTCTILIGPDGERTIIGRAFDAARAGPLPPLAAANCLSLDGYGPGRLAAAQQAREAGLLIVAADLQLDDPLLPLCDVVVLSQALLAVQAQSCQPQAYAEQLRARGPRCVALTAGAAAAGLLTGAGWHWARPPQVELVDATGAGDSFRAGLIHGLLQDWEPERALSCAVAAGSLRCTRPGGAEQPPALQEVLDLGGTIVVWR